MLYTLDVSILGTHYNSAMKFKVLKLHKRVQQSSVGIKSLSICESCTGGGGTTILHCNSAISRERIILHVNS